LKTQNDELLLYNGLLACAAELLKILVVIHILARIIVLYLHESVRVMRYGRNCLLSIQLL